MSEMGFVSERENVSLGLQFEPNQTATEEPDGGGKGWRCTLSAWLWELCQLRTGTGMEVSLTVLSWLRCDAALPDSIRS